jgi:hypothetical protein
VVTTGVLTGEGVCVAGLLDLFLQRPATYDGSSGCSGGGDLNLGGEVREAQQDVKISFDKIRFSENREGSLSNLCLLNKGGGSCRECMRVMNNLRPHKAMTKIGLH